MRYVAALCLLFMGWSCPVVAQQPLLPTLIVEHADVVTEFDGGLVRTSAEYVIHNRGARRELAVFSVPIPRRAAVTRLAMSVAGELVEGEVVPRDRARRIFDGIVAAQRDPALLEWESPGMYRLEVFPIEPAEHKRIVIEHSQIAQVGGGYHPIIGRSANLDPRIRRFDHEVRLADGLGLASTRTGQGPSPVPVAARYWLGEPASARKTQNGSFLLDLALELPPSPPTASRSLMLVVDTSAGGGWDRLTSIREIAAKLAFDELPRKVTVVTGATEPTVCGLGVTKCLMRVELRGATNLEALLRGAVDAAVGPTDIVLFSDGRPTVGAADLDGLAVCLGAAPQVVLHTVAVGDSPDGELLTGLARAGRGHGLSRNDGELFPQIVAARRNPRLWRLSVATTRGRVSNLTPSGSKWYAPGDRLVVAGFARSSDVQIGVTARLGTSVWRENVDVGALPTTSIDGLDAVIEREHVLTLKPNETAHAIEIEQRVGMIGRGTSFLVLEGDAAFREHGIVRSRARDVPQIRSSSVVVSGSLDKQILLGVIRRHNREVRGCYEEALLADPTIAGKLVVVFSVSRGRMQQVGVASDETGSRRLARCVLDSVRSWRFPDVPDGGLITVRYPFSFRPAAAAGSVFAPVDRPTDFVADARERLKKPFPERGLHGALLEHLLTSGASEAELLEIGPPRTRTVRYFIRRLAHTRAADEAQAVGRSWLHPLTAAERADALAGEPRLEQLFGPELARAIIARRARNGGDIDVLRRISPAESDRGTVRAILREYYAKSIELLDQQRRRDPGDVKVLTELASRLRDVGRDRDARLTLTEILEFGVGARDADKLFDRANDEVFAKSP